MNYADYNLTGNCQIDFDTEIRYLCATAKVEKKDLVRFNIENRDEQSDGRRLYSCALKVLRTMRKNKNIQFFVTDEGFSRSVTEAKYIINMYGDFIAENPNKNCISIYVKI